MALGRGRFQKEEPDSGGAWPCAGRAWPRAGLSTGTEPSRGGAGGGPADSAAQRGSRSAADSSVVPARAIRTCCPHPRPPRGAAAMRLALLWALGLLGAGSPLPSRPLPRLGESRSGQAWVGRGGRQGGAEKLGDIGVPGPAWGILPGAPSTPGSWGESRDAGARSPAIPWAPSAPSARCQRPGSRLLAWGSVTRCHPGA